MSHLLCTNCHMDVVAVRSAASMLAKARFIQLLCGSLPALHLGTDC